MPPNRPIETLNPVPGNRVAPNSRADTIDLDAPEYSSRRGGSVPLTATALLAAAAILQLVVGVFTTALGAFVSSPDSDRRGVVAALLSCGPAMALCAFIGVWTQRQGYGKTAAMAVCLSLAIEGVCFALLVSFHDAASDVAVRAVGAAHAVSLVGAVGVLATLSCCCRTRLHRLSTDNAAVAAAVHTANALAVTKAGEGNRRGSATNKSVSEVFQYVHMAGCPFAAVTVRNTAHPKHTRIHTHWCTVRRTTVCFAIVGLTDGLFFLIPTQLSMCAGATARHSASRGSPSWRHGLAPGSGASCERWCTWRC